MRLLFSTRPAYGHLYPLMPLAEAARAAGHEVTFATCGEFVPKLQRLGYQTETVGVTIDEGSSGSSQPARVSPSTACGSDLTW